LDFNKPTMFYQVLLAA